MVAPVRYEASGESKNAATAAISLGSASRPIALIDLMALILGRHVAQHRRGVKRADFGRHVGAGAPGRDGVDRDAALGQLGR